MLRLLIVLCLNIVFVYSGITQSIFNKRYTFDYLSAVFTGIEVTDTCIYATGLVTDTMPPYYLTGIIWAKLDHSGELQNHTVFFKEGRRLSNWYGGLTPYNGGFLSSGMAKKDSIEGTALYYFDNDGQVSKYHEVTPYLPLFDGRVDHNVHPVIGPDRTVLLATRESNTTYGTNGQYETVLQLYDSTGNRVWQRNYGEGLGNNHDMPRGAIPYQDGFLIGSYLNNSNRVRKGYTARHYLFSIDTSGTKRWQYFTPEDTLLSFPRAIYAEEDGSLIVASFLGEETYVNVSTNMLQLGRGYIYKFSPPNNIHWTLQLHTPHLAPALNELTAIVKADDGSGYVLAGYFARYSEEENVDKRGWLVKISPEGDSLWERQLRFLAPTPLSDFHEIYDLEATSDGGYVMAGQVLYDDGNPPMQRAWLLKVDEYGCLVPGCHLVSTEEETAAPNLALQLFPNPATDFINILLRDAHIARRGQAELRLLSGSGQLLRRHPAGKVDGVTNMMPLDGLPAGHYVIQYVADGQLLSAKTFIKQ